MTSPRARFEGGDGAHDHLVRRQPEFGGSPVADGERVGAVFDHFVRYGDDPVPAVAVRAVRVPHRPTRSGLRLVALVRHDFAPKVNSFWHRNRPPTVSASGAGQPSTTRSPGAGTATSAKPSPRSVSASASACSCSPWI